MTSFVFEGPAIGGPSNGRTLVSYSQIFTTLYRLENLPANVTYLFANQSKTAFGLFRYQVHKYGDHWFFLPAGETLEDFLQRWQPPIKQDHWPAFLKQATQCLERKAPQ